MKNKVRRELRKKKTKDTTEHRAIRSDGRIREREGTTKIQEKVSNLRDRRTGNRVPMTVEPGTINSPLSLVI